jgi:hypothetical protein
MVIDGIREVSRLSLPLLGEPLDTENPIVVLIDLI